MLIEYCKVKNDVNEKDLDPILAPGLSKILVLSSNAGLPVGCGWHSTHRGMCFQAVFLVLKSGAMGFHGMMRSMPYTRRLCYNT